MSDSPFSAQVRTQTGLAIIDLSGDINAFAEASLNAAYAEAESSNPGKIVLNFTDAEYINSTGIALIVSLLARARKTRRVMAVYGLSEHYQEIFQITRLSDFMTIFQDEPSALQTT